MTSAILENRTSTTSAGPRRTMRSVGAVLAGLLSASILSIAADAVCHATGLYPPMGQPMSTGLFLLATAYRCAFQALGGYLTARLAPQRPWRHVVILGIVGLVLASVGAAATWNAGPQFGPHWYPLALVVLALPTVLAGGYPYERHARGSASSTSLA